MSSADVTTNPSTETPRPRTCDMKLEVVTLPVAVDDIDAARDDVGRCGVEVSEVFHLAGGRVLGPDPQGRSYQTYASFSDPDGNGWLLQEITTRLPGREWEDGSTPNQASAAAGRYMEEVRHVTAVRAGEAR